MPACIADTNDGPYVFVCYAHADAAKVYPDIEWLNQQGMNVWYDQGIEPGSNWRSTIGDALLGANHVLFFISERSLASAHCNREINLALDEETKVIPIYLEDTELTSDLKVGLTRIQALFQDRREYRQRLLSAVTEDQPPTTSRTTALRSVKSRRPVVYVALAAALLAAILIALPYVLDRPDEVEEATAPALEELRTIAVLPFNNMTSSEEVGFFSQGLTDAVLDVLPKEGYISVASRTQTVALVEQGLGIQALAAKLGVAYVLEGSIQQSGDEMRITAQLIRAADGLHVWSKSYDRAFEGGFRMQEEVAKNIANLTRTKSGYDTQRTHPELFDQYQGIAPEAVTYYLDGQEQYELWALGEGGDPLYSWQLLEKASQLDPNFVAAHLEVAWNYMRRIDPTMSLAEATEGAHAAIDRSLALDSDSVEALFYLAQIYIALDLDYARAEETIERGRRIAPELLWWNAFLADISAREGRAADARRYMTMDLARAQESDDPTFLLAYADVLLGSDVAEQVLEYASDALDLIGEGVERARGLRIQAEALIELGRLDEAQPLIAEAWRLSGAQTPESFAYLFAATGEVERARKVLAETPMGPNNRRDFARAHLALGQPELVFEILRAGIEDHDRSIVGSLLILRDYDPLRDDPRFIELIDFLESKVTHTASYVPASSQ
jgi:TolB-like protein/cytochrome c-type biogenesis protein CcmH/NrfG